jgi:hypothetical protein
MVDPLKKAKRHQARAVECIAIAHLAFCPQLKKDLEAIAADYLQLADAEFALAESARSRNWRL